MVEHYHAVVWIDHHEARILHFNMDQSDESIVRAAHARSHLHTKAGSASGTHLTDDPAFYQEVAAALSDAKEFLVAGPSSAKVELVKYLHRHASNLIERLGGVETLDRVTDNQLLAEARRYFVAADRMRPQIG
jgi:stalled ribosome rescue protein Dom34